MNDASAQEGRWVHQGERPAAERLGSSTWLAMSAAACQLGCRSGSHPPAEMPKILEEIVGSGEGTGRARLAAVPTLSRRWLGALFAALAVSACLSPTLPLPPPSRPTVEGPDDRGYVRLSGRVSGRATVTALNARTSLLAGQQTDESGRYDFSIEATAGDEILFWYSRGNMTSSSVVVVVGEPPATSGGEGGQGGASADE